MSLFNHYSFVVGAVVTGSLLLLFLWRWQGAARWVRVAVMALFIVGAVSLYANFRYPDTNIETVEDANVILTNGRPTFFMFYSNY